MGKARGNEVDIKRTPKWVQHLIRIIKLITNNQKDFDKIEKLKTLQVNLIRF
jgi:hypothetical protein